MDKKKIKLLPLEQLPAVIEVSQLTDNANYKYCFVVFVNIKVQQI